MLILGIDHALSGPCGLAVVDTAGTVTVAHILTYNTRHELPARITRLYRFAEAVLTAHAVAAVACEATYHGPNAKTTIVLEHAAGLLHGLAIAHGLPFVRVRHHETDAIKATLPAAWLALPHITAKHRVHAADAIAIAWHGAGLVERERLLEGAR